MLACDSIIISLRWCEFIRLGVSLLIPIQKCWPRFMLVFGKYFGVKKHCRKLSMYGRKYETSLMIVEPLGFFDNIEI